MRRVLVAGTQDVIDVARAALGDAARTAPGGELELATACSVTEALREVEGGVELVLCNVRFDDSRMFDFLGALNTMPGAGPPVICCRVARAPMSPMAARSTAVGSAESTTKSASLPAASEPSACSRKAACAEPSVYARSASSGVSASCGLNGRPLAVR